MTDNDKVLTLRATMERIREATFAEFQLEMERGKPFNPKLHVCPMCRRASTAKHLLNSWALIQAEAASALRATD